MTDEPRLQWEPYPTLAGGLIARKGRVIANLWKATNLPGENQWRWSVYVDLREKGWLSRTGDVATRQAASDAANAAVPEVEAELAERFPDGL